jgi:leader peptidase (prepilin peptidase)/N-methyltransferase
MPFAALTPETAIWVTVLWMVVLGGIFGSFFNVVIYRLPLGMSLIEPGSHCPACEKPVRWFDNVPVISWVVLRGRCRDCRAPIAVRYPLVEAATAAMFGILAKVEWLSGGTNLPGGEVPLVPIYAYHLVLLCTLLCAALIELDDKRLPLGFFAPAAAVGIAAPLFWPGVHPVPAWPGLDGTIGGLVDSIVGLAAGAMLGFAAWWPWPNRTQTGTLLATACVGLFLGWQAVLALALATVAVRLFCVLAGRTVPRLRRFPPSVVLAVLAFGWILFWAPLVRLGGGG